VTAPDATPAPRAGLKRRLASLVYEALLATAFVLIAGFLLTPLMSPIEAGERALVVPSAWRRAAGFAVLVALLGAYFVHGWTAGRRTLPMKTWRLALVDSTGTPPDRRRALVRYAAAWIGPALAIAVFAATHSRWAAAALALNQLWAFVDRDRAFLHDRVAGTRIVDDRAQAPSRPRSVPDESSGADRGRDGV
jgi:uncharacterized RDD family membrane protein YckC